MNIIESAGKIPSARLRDSAHDVASDVVTPRQLNVKDIDAWKKRIKGKLSVFNSFYPFEGYEHNGIVLYLTKHERTDPGSIYFSGYFYIGVTKQSPAYDVLYALKDKPLLNFFVMMMLIEDIVKNAAGIEVQDLDNL